MSDLKKMEVETKEKIAAVNLQKVAIVSALVASMKVRINELRACIVFLVSVTPTCYFLILPNHIPSRYI